MKTIKNQIQGDAKANQWSWEKKDEMNQVVTLKRLESQVVKNLQTAMNEMQGWANKNKRAREKCDEMNWVVAGWNDWTKIYSLRKRQGWANKIQWVWENSYEMNQDIVSNSLDK